MKASRNYRYRINKNPGSLRTVSYNPAKKNKNKYAEKAGFLFGNEAKSGMRKFWEGGKNRTLMRKATFEQKKAEMK